MEAIKSQNAKAMEAMKPQDAKAMEAFKSQNPKAMEAMKPQDAKAMEAMKPQDAKAMVQENQHNEKDGAAQKAKKAEAAKAWKTKKDAEEQRKAQAAQELIKYLTDKKIELPEEYSKLLNDFAFKKKATSSVGNVFTKLFGENPKVGDAVDLLECYKRTYKSVPEIKRLCKDWESKGIEVELIQDANVVKSKFVLKNLKKM